MNSKKKVVSNTPIGRVLEPSEVAKVIGFLLGDDASGVTGSVYNVDGGWMA